MSLLYLLRFHSDQGFLILPWDLLYLTGLKHYRIDHSLKMLSKVDMAHLSPGLVVYVGLFTEVQNATYLRQQLLDSNTDYEFAFLDAKMVRAARGIDVLIISRLTDRLALVDDPCTSSGVQSCPGHVVQQNEIKKHPL